MFPFMSCIPKIFWRLKGRRSLPPLPDDILVEIISWLPVEDVLRWRLASRKFKELTSTPFFTELHTKRTITSSASSTILVHVKMRRLHYASRFFLIGKEHWQGIIPKVSNSKTHSNRRLLNVDSLLSAPNPKRCHSSLLFTYKGWLLFRNSDVGPHLSFVISNPITKEKVTLDPGNGFICGIFKHPYTKGYRVLKVCPQESSSGSGFMFYIGCLEPKSPEDKYWRQVIKDFRYCPSQGHIYKAPLVVHGGIHWICEKGRVGRPASCSKSILVFDMISESFTVRPHPPMDICSGSPEAHKHMHLHEMDGKLGICVLDYNSNFPRVEVEIWVLEHYADWSWTKKHTKNFHAPHSPFFPVYPVGEFDGELFLHCRSKALLAYNL